MRRLAEVLREREYDRGATAILVALLMTALLGAAGLAVDLGASYAKRQQLQNGADAAALALAQEFAFEDHPCAAAQASGEASGWVSNNVNRDPLDASGTVDCDGLAANELRVLADATQQHWFMPILGRDSSPISADATVEFGVPGTMITSPVTIADCAIPPDIEAEAEIVLWFLDPSGKIDPEDADTCGWHEEHPPGGFSVIEPDEKKKCGITIKTPVELPSAPGSSGVIDECMNAMIGEINFVPIFDASVGTGAGAVYTIVEFAAIRIDFIGFGSKSYGTGGCPDEGRPLWTHKNQDTCLRGTFMGLVSVEDVVGQDLVMPGPDDTAVVARLID